MWLNPTALVTFEDGRVARHHLDVTGVLGQNPYQANLRIDEDHVSGAHARWTLTVGGYGDAITLLVEDLQSTNGLLPEKDADVSLRRPVVLLHPNESIWIGQKVQFTLLAPGFLEDGVFHPCDSHGRRLAPRPAPAPSRSGSRSPLRILLAAAPYVGLVLLSVALYFAFDYFLTPLLDGARP